MPARPITIDIIFRSGTSDSEITWGLIKCNVKDRIDAKLRTAVWLLHFRRISIREFHNSPVRILSITLFNILLFLEGCSFGAFHCLFLGRTQQDRAKNMSVNLLYSRN